MKAIKDLEPDEAMKNFREAADIIHKQMREEIIRRHPYRVARYYQQFTERFSTLISTSQLQEIRNAADYVFELIAQLPENRSRHIDIVRCKESMKSVIYRLNKIEAK